MNTRSSRSVVVALLSLLLAFVAAPTTAHAADLHAIDPAAKGSLTLRTDSEGVVFTVARIQDADVTTSDGWTKASSYADKPAATAGHLDAAVAMPATGADGSTTLAPLAVGFYLVHELGRPNANGGHSPVLGCSDWVISIPMENVGDNAGQYWVYDVVAHPKHERPAITKAVADGIAGVDGKDAPTVGHVLTYTFESTLPQEIVKGYRIVDDIAAQAQYLEFTGTDFPGTVTAALRQNGETRALRACAGDVAAGCDYVVHLTATRLELTLTATGLEAAVGARATDGHARLVTTVQARVRDAVAGATDAGVLDLPDQVTLYPGEGWEPVTSNTVHTRYARFGLHKIDASTGESLSGAVFMLYRTEADAAAARGPIAVGDPTGNDGMVWFRGLHVTDFQNDTVADDAYWLVETTAPDGYLRHTAPVRVQLHQDGTTTADGLAVDATGTLAMPNDRPNVPLPRTGVAAQILRFAASVATSGPGATVAVALLAVTAVGLVVLRRRKENS